VATNDRRPGRDPRRRSAVRLRRTGAAYASLWAATLVAPAHAHTAAEHEGQLTEVEVSGHYDNAVGSSDAASQGTITGRLLQTRPALRPAEVLEFVPGLIATQHSGDGKASQYFLRGFNLDHGTDFATWVGGMPVNLPTHAHGHGYTDLNFLIPELVERIAYRKGPYFASGGDFSSAGSAHIVLRSQLAEPFAQATIGSGGHRRLLAAASPSLDAGRTMLAAVELQGGDGPWDNPEALRKWNAWLRVGQGTRAEGVDLTLMAYHARWNATDQVPQRALDAGTIGRYGAVDPSDGGRTARYSLSAERRLKFADGTLNASAYLIHYRLDLFSNFTYALADPIAGDQFLQRDARNVLGGQLERLWFGRLGDVAMVNELGVQMRHDRIRVGLFDAVDRQVGATTRDDRVRQTSVGVYAENGLTWTPWLRTVAGLRADRFDWDVQGLAPQNTGRTSAALVSPKFTAVLGPWAKTEYFLNWGHGFHSNDGRGTVTRLDPKTGAATTPVTGLVRTVGYEAGLRGEWLAGLQSSLSLWRLALGSELLFVGDAGTTAPSRPSLRQGIEWSNRYVPRPWLLFDADLALSRARFTEPGASGDQVPGAVARVASLAVALRELGPWSASLQLRHLGPRPLTEDGAVKARSTTLLNARVGYRLNRNAELTLDVFNLLDRRVDDIAYYYVSRLRGEAAPSADLHVHPAEPRTARLTLRLGF
jgi:outer membrane receptor protein involved in Fe transport